MAKLKLGIAKLNSTYLILYCANVVSKMDGNPRFPDPKPTLAEVAAKREELKALEIKSYDGDRVAIADRNTVANELKNMLRKLSLYVAFVAEGDAGAILSSGFYVRKESSPANSLLQPSAVKARRTDHKGRVRVNWKPVTNAVNYLVEMTTVDPNNSDSVWSISACTTRSKIDIDNLKPGTYYFFRVKACGRGKESGYSAPATVMAA